MSPVQEASLTASREIRRNLRSTKGIAMFVLFFLGGAVPSVVRVLVDRMTTGAGLGTSTPEEDQQRFAQLLRLAYDTETAKYLSECPPVLFLLFQGTLVFLPLLILLVGFDQIAGEIQHRSIRYIAGRARRTSIVAGKALGIWAVIAVMVLVLHATVWSVMLVRSDVSAGAIASWGLRLWIFCITNAAAYVGLTALVSSFFRTPIVALFVGAASLFGLWLTGKILSIWEATQPITWAFPGSYEKLMVSSEPLHALGGMAALMAWGALCVTAAAMVVNRRDI